MRAAGVQLKDPRMLVLLAREAPLTLAHLPTMPAVPAFSLRPATTAGIVEQIAARAVDLLPYP